MTNYTFPTDSELRQARQTLERMLTAYGFRGNVHDAINALHRMADVVAPRVADSALDSGNTDVRPADGRKGDTWDTIAIVHALNSLTV